MSLDLMLAAAMAGALVFTAWMWVPPRRGSGLEPNGAQTGGPRPGEQRDRIEPFVEPPADFADLVTIGSLEHRPSMPRLPRRLRAARALGAKPGELVRPGDLRRTVAVEVTPEQKRAIVLAAADDVEIKPDEDSERHLSPRERANNKRAAEFRASQYGLVRLDGGVRWVGVDDDARIDTLPPAAVEDDAP